MTVNVAGTVKINSNRHLNLTNGSVRPASPVLGMMFYNTTSGKLEVYNGTSWKESLSQSNGNLYGWGSAAVGKIGDNTTVAKSSPVLVVGGWTDWTNVSGAAGDWSVGIRVNGSAWAWGINDYGQLGTNVGTNTSSPVSVVGGFTWNQVSAGANHNIALRSDGTAWSWGKSTFYGPLGDNNKVNRSSPVSVVGGFVWNFVSAGKNTSALIKSDGTLWTIGSNFTGALGRNNVVYASSPVSVVGGFTWRQVSVGENFVLAIRSNGTAYGWGDNYQGKTGTNSTANISSPTVILGGFTDWVQISAGTNTSGGVRANGTAWTWGRNFIGSLGTNNDGIHRSSPVSVVGGFTDWVQINTKNLRFVGLRANGTAWAWGTNGNGELGTNNAVNTSSPVAVVGGITDWTEILTGYNHTMGLRA